MGKKCLKATFRSKKVRLLPRSGGALRVACLAAHIKRSANTLLKGHEWLAAFTFSVTIGGRVQACVQPTHSSLEGGPNRKAYARPPIRTWHVAFPTRQLLAWGAPMMHHVVLLQRSATRFHSWQLVAHCASLGAAQRVKVDVYHPYWRPLQHAMVRRPRMGLAGPGRAGLYRASGLACVFVMCGGRWVGWWCWWQWPAGWGFPWAVSSNPAHGAATDGAWG